MYIAVALSRSAADHEADRYLDEQVRARAIRIYILQLLFFNHVCVAMVYEYMYVQLAQQRASCARAIAIAIAK